MPLIRLPNISAHNTALHRSKRWPLGSVCGSRRIDSARVTMPIGTLTANSHGHEAIDRIAAATVGPAADEVETTREVKAMPRPNCRRG